MLTALRVANFKAHQLTEIEPELVTAFIGPNNGGKSSLFHALQLMRQASRSSNPELLVPPRQDSRTTERSPSKATFSYPASALDVGAFEDLVRQGQNAIRIGLRGTVPSADLGPIVVDYEADFSSNRLTKHRGKLSTEERTISWEWDKHLSRGYPTALTLDVGKFKLNFQTTAKIAAPLDASGSTTTAPPSFEEENQAEGIRKAFGGAVTNLLLSIRTAYGLRGFEEVGYHIANAPPDFEFQLLDDRTLAMSSAFPYNRALEDEASIWLENLLGVKLRFEMTGTRRVVLKVVYAKTPATPGSQVPLINEGLGLQQVLSILLPVATAPAEGTVLIEEPEAHLHPAAQVALTDLLVETATRQKKQLMMATHSEHMLLGLLANVKKRKLAPDRLALYYVARDEAGISRAKPLRFDDRGRVEGGLPGFFDIKAEQLLDLLKG